MPEWLTIEVYDGEVPASGWRRAHGEDLVEAAVTNGASSWDWHRTPWGVVLELLFATDDILERYRQLPVVRAALDAVPDPLHGLVVYRRRGGGSGSRVPRHPRPVPFAGAAPLPVAEPHEVVRLAGGAEGTVDGEPLALPV